MRRLQKFFSRHSPLTQTSPAKEQFFLASPGSSPSTGTAGASSNVRTSPTSVCLPGSSRSKHSHEDVIRKLLDTYGSLCNEDDFTYTPGNAVNTLSAALEHSRKVMNEEKAKFQCIWQIPENRILSTSKKVPVSNVFVTRENKLSAQERLHALTVDRLHSTLQRIGSGDGLAPTITDIDRTDPKLSRMLKIHKHGLQLRLPKQKHKHHHIHHKRSKSVPEIDWGGATPTLVAKSNAPLQITLPTRGEELNFGKFGYTHVSFLAEGSLGKLHLVTTKDQHLWVAKIVDLTTLLDPAEATQALLEAELLRRLRHPNIVEYRQSFVDDQNLVIIMEFCAGGDLHSHLVHLREDCRMVEEEQVFKWVHQICSGLSHMHTNNVLHCDVKSSNVFLDVNLNAKIGDLGIAKELTRGAHALSPLRCPRGTPVYMSPEMCQRAALTERSDCWAVGCILYEICHLHHAFGSNIHAGRMQSRVKSDKDSVVSSGSAATFLPGVTHRSDMSIGCREMLRNIKGDLKRIKHEAQAERLLNCDLDLKLAYWGGNDQELTFPQVLPSAYCPLLNYMVCAMLEPRPADRPSLTEVLQLIEAAGFENDGTTASPA